MRWMFSTIDVLTIEELVQPGAPLANIPNGTSSGITVPALTCEYGGTSNRFRAAWEVFRGRARAVTWPTHKQEPTK